MTENDNPYPRAGPPCDIEVIKRGVWNEGYLQAVLNISGSKNLLDLWFYTRDISDTGTKADLMNRLYHIAQSVDRFKNELTLEKVSK